MMRKYDYRPRLDTLEDRVPPSDALFSLLFPASSLFDEESGAGLVQLGRPDHCGDTPAGQQGVALLASEAEGPTASALGLGNAGAPVAAPEQAQESALTVSVVQAIGDGPTIQTITVNFGVLPNSSLTIPRFPDGFRFGNDPPQFGLDVDIDKDTGAAVVPADRLNLMFTIRPFKGITININTIAFEDGAGSYDFETGNMTFTASLGFHATSEDLQGFDNENCILVPSPVTLTTKNGAPFSGGDGTMADNTFEIPALQEGQCGSGPFGDYALIFNELAGLPVASGNAILVLNLRQDPPLN